MSTPCARKPARSSGVSPAPRLLPRAANTDSKTTATSDMAELLGGRCGAEHDQEPRAALGPVLGAQLAAERVHDAGADAQPQAGARAHVLGGEEGVEDAGQHLGGDPRARVLHRQL